MRWTPHDKNGDFFYEKQFLSVYQRKITNLSPKKSAN